MGDERISAPAEYFLWHRKGDTQHTNYTKIETHEEQGGIGDALRIFNSKKKAVRRSTGGIILAEPYQIVFDDGARRRTKPETRIKVRFLDFRFGANKEILSLEPVVHTKIVRPGDLREAFSLESSKDGTSAFVMDFGMGIVPIHIVGEGVSENGEPLVFFVDEEDFRRSASGKGTKHLVQLYRAHRELVRLAGTSAGKGARSELDFARENDRNIRRVQGDVVPRILCWGRSHLVPGESSIPGARKVLIHLLERVLDQGTTRPSRKTDVSRTPEEELTPFGFFE